MRSCECALQGGQWGWGFFFFFNALLFFYKLMLQHVAEHIPKSWSEHAMGRNLQNPERKWTLCLLFLSYLLPLVIVTENTDRRSVFLTANELHHQNAWIRTPSEKGRYLGHLGGRFPLVQCRKWDLAIREPVLNRERAALHGMCPGWCKSQSRAAKEPEAAEWNASEPEVQECGHQAGLKIKLALWVRAGKQAGSKVKTQMWPSDTTRNRVCIRGSQRFSKKPSGQKPPGRSCAHELRGSLSPQKGAGSLVQQCGIFPCL